MKKRLAIMVITIAAAAALTACGTAGSTAKEAGQLPAELIAMTELPEIKEAEDPAEGELLADQEEPEQEAETTEPVDTVTADRPVTGKNNTGNVAAANGTGSTAPAVSNTNTSPAAVKGTTGGTGSTGTTTPSAPTPAATTPAPAASTPAPTQQHTHTWVQHEAAGHYETKVTKDAWDEAVYETQARTICNECGADITGNIDQHVKESGYTCGMSYHTDYQRTLTGYVHHDAETTQVWVEDSPAYSECSSCGARQ